MIHIAELTQPQVNKLRKLKPPHEFKNYKELCEYLGIEMKGGNKKKSTLKDISQYASLEKKGYKIIISCIYENIIEKEDNRKGSETRDKIETLLLDQGFKLETSIAPYAREINAFVDEEIIPEEKSKNRLVKRNIYITPKELMYAFGIINENYKECMYQIKNTSSFLGMNYKIVNDFFSTSSKNNYYAIESTLKKMENKMLIEFEKWKIIITNDKKFIIPDSQTKSIIGHAEKKVLQEMKLNGISNVIAQQKVKEFKENVVKKLHKEDGLTDIKSYYSTYKISFIKSLNEEDSLTKEHIKNIKKDINKTTQQKLMRNAKKRNKDTTLRIENREDKSRHYYDDFRSEDAYIYDYEKLTNKFVNMYAKSFVDKFKIFVEIHKSYEDMDFEKAEQLSYKLRKMYEEDEY